MTVQDLKRKTGICCSAICDSTARDGWEWDSLWGTNEKCSNKGGSVVLTFPLCFSVDEVESEDHFGYLLKRGIDERPNDLLALQYGQTQLKFSESRVLDAYPPTTIAAEF